MEKASGERLVYFHFGGEGCVSDFYGGSPPPPLPSPAEVSSSALFLR